MAAVKVFVDVGANVGQTLEEAMKAKWHFGRLYAFEPMWDAFWQLAAAYGEDPHVDLLPYGLSDHDGPCPVYGTNEILEASIWPTKSDVDASVVATCEMLDAGKWFKEEIDPDDYVVVKLNCEGAEIPILDSLIASEQIHTIDAMMIDFDIRRVIGREEEEQRVIDAMRRVGFTNYKLCEQVMVGATHQDRIANWLGGLR